jgi:hypothetical protein
LNIQQRVLWCGFAAEVAPHLTPHIPRPQPPLTSLQFTQPPHLAFRHLCNRCPCIEWYDLNLCVSDLAKDKIWVWLLTFYSSSGLAFTFLVNIGCTTEGRFMWRLALGCE